jgi:hypothetical protein
LRPRDALAMPSLIIAGGRDWTPKPSDYALVKLFIFNHDIDEIVSGHCTDYEGNVTGADKMGEDVAKVLGLKLTTFKADWKKYNKSAGPIRNKLMAEYADGCILFKGGRGTASMKREAINAGIPIYYEEV